METQNIQVKAHALKYFSPLVKELGKDPLKIFTQAGVDPIYLDNPSLYIEFFQYAHLLDLAAAECQCPHFGILLGGAHDISILGPIGRLGLYCSNVGEAMRSINSFFHLQSGGASYIDKAEGNIILKIREPLIPELANNKVLQDLAIAGVCQIMRTFCGSHWNPVAVYLSHPQPQKTEPYQQLFRAPVYFNQEFQALGYLAKDLELPLNSADTEMKNILHSQFTQLSQSRTATLRQQVNSTINLLLSSGRCNVETVAKSLSMHSRTLHRQLSAEGTTFKELLNDNRHSLACDFLRNTQLSLVQICLCLGYSDATAFSRAFKRWENCSPAEWRKQHSSIGHL
ncbi:MAG: AraC family transcriptional regulator [Cellvibrionaceae bacterium]|nr:AraC family transcriptional regulator [Cellvibrionaceae bacterium]